VFPDSEYCRQGVESRFYGLGQARAGKKREEQNENPKIRACIPIDSAYIQFMNPIRSGWGPHWIRKKRGGMDIFLTRNKITFNIKLLLV
jgi:hypothetical protein